MAGNKFAPDFLTRFTGVGWGGGCYILVTAKAFYNFGVFGTRLAKVELTTAGKDAGGTIVEQKLWHVAELDDGSAQAHPAYSLMRAVLAFSSTPDDTAAMFTVDLAGSITYADGSQPPPSQRGFCGTVTTTMTYTGIYKTESPVKAFWQDGSNTWSTPGGSGGGSFTLGPLANVQDEDVGTGASSRSTVDRSIWYRDAYGNYIDTRRPCSELPPAGGAPPVSAARIEGFDFISAWAYPKAGNFVLPSKVWAPALPDDAFVSGEATFMATVPRTIVGLNADFGAIYDDLATGLYEWRHTKLTFRNLPPDRTTTPPSAFDTFAAYPLSPKLAAYHIIVTTTSEPPTTPPTPAKHWAPPKEPPLPGATRPDEKFFPAGQPPSFTQNFVELK